MSINLEVCLILLRYCAQIFLYSCQIFKKFYIEKTTRYLQFVCWVICNVQTSVVMKILGGKVNLHASVYGSLISKFIIYLMSRIQQILHKRSCQRLGGSEEHTLYHYSSRELHCVHPLSSLPPPYAVFTPTLFEFDPIKLSLPLD